jgi:hypothetical protein
MSSWDDADRRNSVPVIQDGVSHRFEKCWDVLVPYAHELYGHGDANEIWDEGIRYFSKVKCPYAKVFLNSLLSL